MDPTPLRPRQIWALATAVSRELLWGLRAVSREVEAWRVRARTIPDAPLREDALDSIARKRTHADGAALFWTLPRRRHPALLALLVAYQTMWDYLDNVSEHGAQAGYANGEMLHEALVDALDPEGAIGEHYRHHTHDGDGGYLREIVRGCRGVCAGLANFDRVRPLVLSEAAGCAIQTLNHDPDPESRDAALRAWAQESELAGSLAGELSWFERAAAVSASLVPHALLALAAEERCSAAEVARTRAAYMPWASLVTAMLDSFSDRLEDASGGTHSYVGHYEEEELHERLAAILARAAREVASLRGGEGHAIIVACVVALYLSKDSVLSPEEWAQTERLARSGGTLPWVLLPVLRAWRMAYALRAV